ncbi:MAG: glycosyltransferase [Planctomycetia bacterium]|nr:glycosyltransferase [Planctomycetia bacterium]
MTSLPFHAPTPDILPCERPAVRPAERPAGGLLSIVVPCHNEEAVVAATHARLVAAVAETGMELEVVYVDDGSRDQTLARLEAIAARDRRAVVVELSRNFGQQAAMSVGLAQARGAAVVIIDADLQDPPEVIPEMVRAWRDGVDVAYGRRRSREGETRFKLVTASLFHRLFASLVPHPIPVDTGDFKLLDRAVVDAVCSLPEKRRYLRGLVPWAGFRDAPMRLTWACSLLLAATGLAAAIVSVWSSFGRAAAPQAGVSLAAVTAVVGLMAAAQTAAVAVVGEYVVRTYRETQGRPTAVVRRTLNAPEAAGDTTPVGRRPDRSSRAA